MNSKRIKIFCVVFIILALASIATFHFYRFSKLRYVHSLYAEDWSTVIFLIQKGIDPLTEDGYGYNAFQRAAYDAPLETLQELIELGVPYNSVGSNGKHPILITASRERWDVIDWLLELDGGLDQNILRELLLISVLHGKTDLTSKLINRKISINIYSQDGFTPLHITFFSTELLANPKNLWEMIKLLLDNGADVNALSHPKISTSDSYVGIHPVVAPERPGTSSTPLDLAEKIGNEKIIDLLKKHGAIQSPEKKVSGRISDMIETEK